MTRLIERVAPHATDLVRRDHSLVLATFHRYHATTSPRIKRALVRSACLALEVHAQVEEEILYPAVREVSQSDFLRRAVPEHDEMRRLIGQLRDTSPESPGYDANFMALMRDVMHHVADEETLFLPEAERVLRGRLGELGARMLRRRLALMAPRLPRLAYERTRGAPVRSVLGLLAVVLGGVLIGRQLSERHA
jgi:hypothetical protein